MTPSAGVENHWVYQNFPPSVFDIFAFPELPTIGELYPGYEMTIWLGLFAPAGTPEAVLGRLREEIAKTLASPDVKERLARAGGLQPFVTSPAEFAALIRRDYDKYGKLVREIGVRAD